MELQNTKITILNKIITYLSRVVKKEENKLYDEWYNECKKNFGGFKNLDDKITYNNWKKINGK